MDGSLKHSTWTPFASGLIYDCTAPALTTGSDPTRVDGSRSAAHTAQVSPLSACSAMYM